MKEIFTKGEWVIDGFNTTAVLSMTIKDGSTRQWKQYQHICNCDYGQFDPSIHLNQNKANAAFISASPDMYNALKELIRICDLEAIGSGELATIGEWQRAVALAKKAIKKANTVF